MPQEVMHFVGGQRRTLGETSLHTVCLVLKREGAVQMVKRILAYQVDQVHIRHCAYPDRNRSDPSAFSWERGHLGRNFGGRDAHAPKRVNGYPLPWGLRW